MWIARNEDGTLTIFSLKPVRQTSDDGKGFWKEQPFVDYDGLVSYYPGDLYTFESNAFDDIEWACEPVEIELVPKETETNGHVARNSDGSLQLFKTMPVRYKVCMYDTDDVERKNLKAEDDFWDEEGTFSDGQFDENDTKHYRNEYFDIETSLFPELTWNDEPIEVQFKRKE